MPLSIDRPIDLETPEIRREMLYATKRLQHDVEINTARLNPEQVVVYDIVMQAVHKQEGKITFLDAPGGTGMYITL